MAVQVQKTAEHGWFSAVNPFGRIDLLFGDPVWIMHKDGRRFGFVILVDDARGCVRVIDARQINFFKLVKKYRAAEGKNWQKAIAETTLNIHNGIFANEIQRELGKG